MPDTRVVGWDNRKNGEEGWRRRSAYSIKDESREERGRQQFESHRVAAE